MDPNNSVIKRLWCISLAVSLCSFILYLGGLFSVVIPFHRPCHVKTCLQAYADSEGPDQPGGHAV